MSRKLYDIGNASPSGQSYQAIKSWLETLPGNSRFIKVFFVSSIHMGIGYTIPNNQYGACLVFGYLGLVLFKKTGGVWQDPIVIS